MRDGVAVWNSPQYSSFEIERSRERTFFWFWEAEFEDGEGKGWNGSREVKEGEGGE